MENVESGSSVMTDEHSRYRGLSILFAHDAVRHKAGEYVNGKDHANGIENFWAMLARGSDGKRLRYNDWVAAS